MADRLIGEEARSDHYSYSMNEDVGTDQSHSFQDDESRNGDDTEEGSQVQGYIEKRKLRLTCEIPVRM